ncbi:MAG: CDP-alcohol phosphatidyltransferase family protein [Bacteroidales bacterium]|nr:CDP-alcohol phosphatidyltransferase family protein [Bacteroidales bacterium]
MDKKAERIQTSFLNGIERKALVWLAERQARWVSSDLLTWIGTCGSVLIALGYILSNFNVHWLWLSTFGLIVNWYGDSLDGTVARVRKTQRPIYGYYIDHTVDGINETLMFVGIGLSPFLNLYTALAMLVVYLQLTLNVSMNAHLKAEFKLTYAGLGPTEFRLIVILLNTLLILIKPWQQFEQVRYVLGKTIFVHALDYPGLVILAILVLIYFITIFKDARYYARIDPMPKHKEEKE